MLRPKLVLKPKPTYSQRQKNYNDPQLEVRIQSTTTRESVSSARDWNITQEAAPWKEQTEQWKEQTEQWKGF
jgi:hypothetical protein